MPTDEETAKTTIGCATILFMIPASLIWWVLFGIVLHKIDAGTMEWSLYVGYLIMSAIALAGGSLFKLLFDK